MKDDTTGRDAIGHADHFSATGTAVGRKAAAGMAIFASMTLAGSGRLISADALTRQ